MIVTQSNGLIKPSIIIRVLPHDGDERKLREIWAGIEEEGVPYSSMLASETDPVVLSYTGAADSPLGVGIGVSEAGLCVHHNKLPACEPLFRCESGGEAADWRRFGCNAARLVKGLPFKERTTADSSVRLSRDELVNVVQAIVSKVLQETNRRNGR